MDGFRNEGWHVLGQDCPGRAVVEYYEILGGRGGIKGISITVPARLRPNGRVVSRTLAPRGYGLLMAGASSRWSDMKRPPSYLIVGYTKEGRR